jgi:tetratricopeptide (TPR) repeat protein
VHSALIGLLEGALAEAEGLIEDARRKGDRIQSWNAAVSYGLQLYVLRREQGRLAEVEDLVRHSAEEYPTYPIWRCVLAQMTAALGYAAEARDLLEALAADGFVHLPFDETWLASMGFLAETASAVGDAERASEIYRLLLPYSDRIAVSVPEISTGAVARYLGLLATTIERWNDAERHFDEALEINERIGARPSHANTQHDYAHMLVARDAPGDHRRAQLLLSHAHTAYRQLGLSPTA